MAQINRSSIIQNSADLMNLQSGRDKLPAVSIDNVQPVIEVGPKFSNITRHTSSNATGSVTIFTTPLDKDFYITSAFLTLTKDATSDNVSTGILIYQGGTTRDILNIRSQTTTTLTMVLTNNYSYPIKCDRGTNITLFGTMSAGTMQKEAGITGVLVE